MMNTPISVLGICGSLRDNSYNAAVLRAAVEVCPPELRITVYDRAALARIPHFNTDMQTSSGFPPVVQHLRDQIRQNNAVLFVTPEYNYSIPGVLKNAIDWASRPEAGSVPFANKAVGIMGASTGGFGTVRAQLHLRHIVLYLNAYAVNKPEVLIPFVRDKVDADGRLTDEPTRGFIREHLLALAALSQTLNAHVPTA